MTLDASEGNPSIVDPVAAAAKPVAGPDRVGAARSGRSSAAAAAGATSSTPSRTRSRSGSRRRCTARSASSPRSFGRAVETELSAMDDNPLVVVAERRMISNGNFHPIAMALALDALRPAIAHVGQLSDRRMNHLWAILLGRLDMRARRRCSAPPELSGPMLRYAAATRAAELRELAGPVTLDIGPLDHAVEDHATNAVTAARRSAEALERLEDVLAIELVMAWQTAGSSPAPLTLGSGTRAALEALEAAVPVDGAGLAAAFHARRPAGAPRRGPAPTPSPLAAS